MSRIHDALKKAEQERTAVLRPEPLPAPVELLQNPAATAIADLRPRESSGPAARPTALTIEALRQNCPRPRWNPDLKTMLFFQKQEHGPGMEEFRTLRSRLYKIREKRPLQTLLITSALPAEGKTFVAANLAQVISRQHERRAVLVDADLRKSRLHVSLGAPSKPGLSEYLLGEADEYAMIQRSPQENLFFIPGGRECASPAELISGDRMKNLLKRLATVFDWVIVDSPPIVPVSDASLLAELCDGVLMVVQAAATPYDLAQKACQEFREKNLVGAVMNRAERGVGYDSYYYKYGSYGYGSHSKNGKD